ncbi:tail protein X [Sphingomonas sp. LB2R24]|uniref:tail protein X n=1 Tax=Sphingomonas sorbitolis TaxID=3096165 RepID=UPI002FC632D5
MPDTLTALQGDTLDELIWRERAFGAADISRVLDLNPGIVDLGPVLPVGTVVIVPTGSAPAATVLPLIQLWD